MNSQKITGLGAGAASTDAAQFGQISYGGLFGDGSDGSATLDGAATVSWASRSGSTYTLTLTASPPP